MFWFAVRAWRPTELAVALGLVVAEGGEDLVVGDLVLRQVPQRLPAIVKPVFTVHATPSAVWFPSRLPIANASLILN